MSEIERILDNQEAARSHLTGQLFFTWFEGHLKLDLFKRALKLLCDRHIFLKSFLKSDNSKFILCANTTDDPKLVIVDSNETPPGSLVDCDYDVHERNIVFYLGLNSQDFGYLAIRSNHMVTDGHGAADIFTSLWEAYAILVEGGEPKPEGPPTLVKSSEELLQERWGKALPAPPRTLTEDLKNGRESLSSNRRALDKYTEVLRLDDVETRQIITTAKKHRTTTHAIISGAFLTEIRYQDTRSGCQPIVCAQPVDLRGRVTPKVEPLEATNFVFTQVCKLTLPKKSDIIEVAHEVREQITHSITNRKLFVPGVMMLKYFDYLTMHGVNVFGITNPGIINMPHVKGLKIFGLSEPRTEQEKGQKRRANHQVIYHEASATHAEFALATIRGRMVLNGTYYGPDVSDGELTLRAVERILTLK